MFSRKNWLKLSIGFLISAVCLFFALSGIDWAALSRIFLTVKIPFVLLFLLILCLTVALRSLIYYRFLGRQCRVSLPAIFEGLMIGYMVNSLFPLRAGDVAKAFLIGTMNRTSRTYTFTIVVIERLFDMITLLIFFLVLLLQIGPGKHFTHAAAAVAVAVALVLAFIAAVLGYTRLVLTTLDRLKPLFGEAPVEKIKCRIATVKEGFTVLTSWRDVLFIQGIFLLIWGGYLAVNYVTGLAIGVNLGFAQTLSLIIAIALGSVIASTPGQLGVHQYACVLVFTTFGFTREEGLSFSLIQNSLSFAMPILLGWLFLLHANISLAQISQEKGLPKESADESAPSPLTET
ncbi:MAG: lysylphosphatidylglycerol synthase transmembrane domain-containing protein [Candidatus Eremiobacteraeota bacterium]|nr:lysylphosphatidylglycerol synthase transmembrane domain-containing protein [Candidatus Eremiobacteraeota bacterium]